MFVSWKISRASTAITPERHSQSMCTMTASLIYIVFSKNGKLIHYRLCFIVSRIEHSTDAESNNGRACNSRMKRCHVLFLLAVGQMLIVLMFARQLSP